ncbi:MAG: PAS domain-containing protein [Verrucomicrobia bacterium]|nr:PAS domain-containing protein [Verrucomicrobiota bacterium]
MMSEPNHTASWPELTAILLVRLAFLWLLVLLSLAMPNDDAVFYAFMGFAFIITIPYSLWLRSKLRSTQFASLQFLVDLVLVTGLIYFTGGINSDLTLLYPLVILSAGMVGTPRQAAQITFLGIVIYLLMATLLSQDMIVEYLPDGNMAEPQAIYPAVLLRILTFACFGLVSIYVSKRCSYISQHKNDAKETADTLLGNLQAGVLMLDSQGQVFFANPAACKMVNAPEAELCNQTFIELCTTGTAICQDTYGTTAYLARPGTSPLPVSYRTADIKLPATALANDSAPQNECAATLLVFTDLSHPLELEHQLKQVERITTATRIAGEMAHEIRTPLTAISASVQLLEHYEKKATAADWLPNSPRRKDRAELFAHIADAAEQMDSVVKNFVDFAEFSPADLLSIIKLDSIDENNGYIGRLNTIAKGLENGQNSDRGRRPDNSKFVE